MRELSTPEICAYLRLLRESLRLNEYFLSKSWPTFDEQSIFWQRYGDACKYCDIVNPQGGLALLIDGLEHTEKR